MDRQLSYHARRLGRPVILASGRSGYVAVIALLFMALIGVMAAGLYSMVQSSTVMTSNERQVAKALGATETGVEFFRYQINQAVKSMTASFDAAGTNKVLWMNTLQANLQTTLNGSNGIDTTKIAYIGASGGTPAFIDIPSIAFGSDASFKGKVTVDNTGNNLFLVVTGASGSVTRTAQVGLTVTPASSGGPVMFPMMTKLGIPKAWNVTPDGESKVQQYGTVTLVDLIDGTLATALLYPGMTAPSVAVPFPNNNDLIAAVAGLGLKPITDPSTQTTTSTFFPAVYDKKGKLVTAAYTVTTVVAQNSCSIPPNTNPTLTGTINGVIYVQWPNNVTLDGNLTINGTIVMQRQGGNSGTSTVTLNRDGVIQRSMDAANTEIMKLSFPGNDQMKWWTLIAPDANFDLPNGTVWDTTKVFEGSLHFKSCSRTGGGDQAGFGITKGGMVAEGSITFGSNGASYTINSDTSGEAGGKHVDGIASLAWNTYDEPLPQN